jgi:hypothetical protein
MNRGSDQLFRPNSGKGYGLQIFSEASDHVLTDRRIGVGIAPTLNDRRQNVSKAFVSNLPGRKQGQWYRFHYIAEQAVKKLHQQIGAYQELSCSLAF